MNTKTHTRNFVLTTLSATAFLLMGSVSQLATALEPQPFEGVASLCATDPEPTWTETTTRGNGVTIMKVPVQLFRIETEPEGNLMNGWEVLTSMFKTTKSNTTYYMGTALLTPVGFDGSDALKENFNILQDGSLPSGTYSGTGDLEGVTVDYQLTPYSGDPAVLASMCSMSPPYCEDSANTCTGTAGFFGWSISGVIYDDRAE